MTTYGGYNEDQWRDANVKTRLELYLEHLKTKRRNREKDCGGFTELEFQYYHGKDAQLEYVIDELEELLNG